MDVVEVVDMLGMGKWEDGCSLQSVYTLPALT